MDVLAVRSSMPFMQRLQALRKIRTSSHLPHPDISTKQTERFSWPTVGDEARSKGARLVIDGESLGLVKSVRMQVIPDAITLYV
jgi:diacylglycerol kinase family enzyme